MTPKKPKAKQPAAPSTPVPAYEDAPTDAGPPRLSERPPRGPKNKPS